MLVWMLALGGALLVLTIIALLTDRHADRTIIERMESPNRTDGRNDPRAYLDHSSY